MGVLAISTKLRRTAQADSVLERLRPKGLPKLFEDEGLEKEWPPLNEAVQKVG